MCSVFKMMLTVLERPSSSVRRMSAIPSPSDAGHTSFSPPSISSLHRDQTTGEKTSTVIVICHCNVIYYRMLFLSRPAMNGMECNSSVTTSDP